MLEVGKIVLLFLIWSWIILSILFLLNSKKLFKKLKGLDLFCQEKKKEFIHDYVPVLASISEGSKNINTLMNIKKAGMKDIIIFSTDLLFALNFYKGMNISLNLLNKFLKTKWGL